MTTTVKVKRGKVRMGRTMFKAGIFLPWAVMRPSRKADTITIITSAEDPNTPYEATVAGHNERWAAYQAAHPKRGLFGRGWRFWLIVIGLILTLIFAWPLFAALVGGTLLYGGVKTIRLQSR